jgi:ArsR family transcriptional regulator, arsenate/arsenite/antimonite-responsive transcriptional repressor
MNNDQAASALAALAQEHRLGIYRLLVKTGPEGMPAGAIADRLGFAASSLSFHLAHLNRSGLISQRRAGRSLIYSADFDRMNDLIAFLTDNCCGGQSCAPATKAKRA